MNVGDVSTRDATHAVAAEVRRVLDASAAGYPRQSDADIVVVEPPAHFSPLWWWKSAAGDTLRRSTVPVVVASRKPRELRACVVAVRAEPGNVEGLPPWLGAFDSLEAVIALEVTPIMVGSVVGMPVPTAFLDGSFVGGAQKSVLRVACECRRAFGGGLIIGRTTGSVLDGISSAFRRRRVDAVFLSDGTRLPGFGRTLRHCIDVLGISVIVPPKPMASSGLGCCRSRPAIAVVP